MSPLLFWFTSGGNGILDWREEYRFRKRGAGLYGVIYGDIAGSKFEGCYKLCEEDVFVPATLNHEAVIAGVPAQELVPVPFSSPTDDSVLTLAVASALMECRGKNPPEQYDEESVKTAVTKALRSFGRAYVGAGYGSRFLDWLYEEEPKPYGSYGNGAAMRVSPAGLIARSEQEARGLGRWVTEVTHNHPEGVRAGECTAHLAYLAKVGTNKRTIYEVAHGEYGYGIPRLSKAKAVNTHFDVTCQGCMPVALACFLESADYLEMFRNAVSFGGDADTIAAIVGGFGGVYYTLPEWIKRYVEVSLERFDAHVESVPPLVSVLREFTALPEVRGTKKVAFEPEFEGHWKDRACWTPQASFFGQFVEGLKGLKHPPHVS